MYLIVSNNSVLNAIANEFENIGMKKNDYSSLKKNSTYNFESINFLSHQKLSLQCE